MTFETAYRSLGHPGDEAKLRKFYERVQPADPKTMIRNVVEHGIFPHQRGNWCKKVAYKQRNLGSWSADPTGAEAVKRLRLLQNGDTTPKSSVTVTLKDAVNEFLHRKEQLIPDELSQSTWNGYRNSMRKLLEFLPGSMRVEEITTSHLADLREHLAKQVKVTTLKNEIIEMRMLFKWCNDSGKTKQPIRFGDAFNVPKRSKLDKHMAKRPTKLYRPEAIRAIINEAGVQMRAKILLAINCAYGPTDCVELRLDSLDLDQRLVGCEAGLLDGMVQLGARGKTSVPRGAALWPETVEALRLAIEQRREPREEFAPLVFVSTSGGQWDYRTICRYFKSIKAMAGVDEGGMYWLRHTFETVSRGAKDQQATNAVMGHRDGSMADVYTHGIERQRLVDVAEFVRGWLFPKET